MTYEQALANATTTGAAHADDTTLMAMFCNGPLQTLAGAVSPKLVFEGALKRGMTTNDLTAMCANTPAAVAGLMW